ncbi:MAG: 6,7-dimethyl-8-ribityllumazine synthase [Rikenellaceae bacterium]
MASELNNLSEFEFTVPSAEGMNIAIVVAKWNSDITSKLLEGAENLCREKGAKFSTHFVPGTYELTMGAKMVADKLKVDAVIAIGCVIKGDTPHFEYICSGVTHGLNMVAIDCNIPVIFGVLTVNTHEQAMERCGGRLGNKGEEAAATAISMVALGNNLPHIL